MHRLLYLLAVVVVVLFLESIYEDKPNFHDDFDTACKHTNALSTLLYENQFTGVSSFGVASNTSENTSETTTRIILLKTHKVCCGGNGVACVVIVYLVYVFYLLHTFTLLCSRQGAAL
jgi:hypothetical protein